MTVKIEKKSVCREEACDSKREELIKDGLERGRQLLEDIRESNQRNWELLRDSLELGKRIKLLIFRWGVFCGFWAACGIGALGLLAIAIF